MAYLAAEPPPLGIIGWSRWSWRQLTSMRTALLLLFLLALAAIPGSVFPQRGSNPLRVKQWMTNNPVLGEWVDRLGMFDVYASPWFSAVYLLLFISLIGCLVPRTAQLARALRRPPPPAPRRMSRMPMHSSFLSSASASEVLDDAERILRERRLRTRRGTDAHGNGWVAGEKGRAHDIGNLVFHVSLVFVLVAVAISGLFGWKGNVIVREGSGFANTLTQYDAWGGGRFFDSSSLRPFSFVLDSFAVEFERGEVEAGSPRLFAASVTYRSDPASPAEPVIIGVNEPLFANGAKVFLVGHGYAPRFVIRDAGGRIVFDDTVPFLPQDGNMTSTGVVKAPDADPPIGLSGIFAPTAALSQTAGPYSTFPAPDDPAVFLAAFQGDLGLDGGAPQSIYSLDTSRMEQLGLETLRPGQTWDLPRGAGTVTFGGFERWASFQIASDPGKEIALLATVVAIAALIAALYLRPRRVWVTASPTSTGSGTTVEVAALTKTPTDAELPELRSLTTALRDEPLPSLSQS